MVAHLGRPLDMFNEAYEDRNLENARSALKNIDFSHADDEACTQLKEKYSRLLREIVPYPSPIDLDSKINFLGMFFLSQIPVMMRASFAHQLKVNINIINTRIKEIETPLPEEKYKTKTKEIRNSADYLPNERLNADNYQIFANARLHPTFEYEVEKIHIRQEKLKERLDRDPELPMRKGLKDRLDVFISRVYCYRIVSSDFDDPRDISRVLLREKGCVNTLELSGNGLDEQILIDIIGRISQTSLTTLSLFGVAWTNGIANCLAGQLRIRAKVTTLTIGKSTEHIEPETTKLLLSALAENESITHLEVSDTVFSDPSQRETLSQVLERNRFLAFLGGALYPKDSAPKIFYEWGNRFFTGTQNVPQDHNQSFKWYARAAKLDHEQAIRIVTLSFANDQFNPNTIGEKLAQHSLSLQQLRQWIEKLRRQNSLTLKQRQILTYNLGQLYENKMIDYLHLNGEVYHGVDRDKEAVRLYREAAKDREEGRGLIGAQKALARMSEQGRGIGEQTNGKVQAKYWYNQAALQGDRQASIEVQRLKRELYRK